jgi:hypothetical protein
VCFMSPYTFFRPTLSKSCPIIFSYTFICLNILIIYRGARSQLTIFWCTFYWPVNWTFGPLDIYISLSSTDIASSCASTFPPPFLIYFPLPLLFFPHICISFI